MGTDSARKTQTMHLLELLLVGLLSSAQGLSSPTARGGLGSGRSVPPNMAAMTSRRSALLAAAAGLAAAFPLTAEAVVKVNDNAKAADLGYVGDVDYVSGTDDAIARIAKKTREKNEAEKAAKFAATKAPGQEEAELAAAQEEAKRNILLVGGGGTLLSSAFFYKNLQRLFTKIMTAGEDTGYGTPEDIRYRKAVAAEKARAAKSGEKMPAKKASLDPRQVAGVFGINLYGKK